MAEAKPGKELPRKRKELPRKLEQPRTLEQRLDELWRVFKEKCAEIERAHPRQHIAPRE